MITSFAVISIIKVKIQRFLNNLYRFYKYYSYLCIVNI
nr:MAG TPA: hypothetical protein [Caudoviricetes sp.]